MQSLSVFGQYATSICNHWYFKTAAKNGCSMPADAVMFFISNPQLRWRTASRG